MLFCEKQSIIKTFFPIFKLIVMSIIIFFALLSFNSLFASQIKIIFNPSSDHRVVGHKIYYGTSTTFGKTVDLGTATSCVVSNLKEGTTYYFAATAYDKNNNESEFSNIVSHKIPNQTRIDDVNNSFEIIEDFENYTVGGDPLDWFDTKARSSMVEDNNLFKIFRINNNKVFGTTSTQVNINSHHIEAYIEDFFSVEYSGRMMMTDPDGGIGVTFLSHYPFTDAYYRLRSDSWSLSFHLAPRPHGIAKVYGMTDSGVTPIANVWYRFRIRVQDTGKQTEILAKVWPENESEPKQWQIDAYDDSPDRLNSGTFGVWSGWSGGKFWDDLNIVNY